MKHLFLLGIIVVLRASDISAQTLAPEHPSIIPDVNDSGEIQIINNKDGFVFESKSTGTFDVNTKSVEANSARNSTFIARKSSYQMSKLHHKKSLHNSNSEKKQKKK